MFLVIKENSELDELLKLKEFLKKKNLKYYEFKDKDIKKIVVIKGKSTITKEEFKKFECVKDAKLISKPFKLASRESKNSDTVIEIKGRKIGENSLVVMAGPCSIESREMILDIAKKVKDCGGEYLRGGAFKPRTSPYDFQGLGEDGLKYMREACDRYDLIMVTEVMDSKDIELISKYTDVFQVGTRNMQNFSLLKELGKVKKPVLLKRGMSATIREFLMAAEYIMAYGNKEVILCERGIRTFEIATRNTVDINAIALLKEKTHLPVIIDASHGTGKRSLVEPVTLGCILAGADGAMIEVHENPCCALSDGDQTLNFCEFESLMNKIKETLEFKEKIRCL